MFRRILVLVLVLCLVGTVNVFAEEDKNLEVEVNGKALEMPAKIMEGELFLPLRAVSEGLGFDVQWFGSKQEITMNTSERDIHINLSEIKATYNKHEAYINGGYRTLDGRTYLRQDFYLDILGLKVMWDKAAGKVVLESVEENGIVINTVKKSAETDTLLINIQYPELKGLDTAEVESRLNSSFAKLAEDAVNRGNIVEKDILPEQTANGIKAEVYFNYQVKYNRNGLLSIVFYDYLYSGGAHGLTIQSSYSFDLKTGKEYGLKDFYEDGTDYVSIVSSQVKEQMEEREMTDYLTPFEAIMADQAYYLSNKGLVIYFQAYEYYPYAAGIPEFTLNYPLQWVDKL